MVTLVKNRHQNPFRMLNLATLELHNLCVLDIITYERIKYPGAMVWEQFITKNSTI